MPLQMFPAKGKKSKENVPKVIAIAAGKGGVGKSTVAVNLALALCNSGQRVGLFDADIYGPSIRKMLPEVTPPSQQDDRLVPAICHGGIRMMSMAYFRKEKEAAAIRAPIANGIIQQFIKNTSWGNLDYLLIDFPPGTGDIQLTLSQQANLLGAIMVTTPQEVSVMDVQKAMHLFNQVQVPLIGIIENMSFYRPHANEKPVYLFGKGGGRKLAESSGVPFLGEIPVDPEISRCCDVGEPLISLGSDRGSQAFMAFMSIAKNVMEEVLVLQKDAQDALQNFELIWKEMPADANTTL
jgi:ATP-binding protein involved in chromosome partitioning